MNERITVDLDLAEIVKTLTVKDFVEGINCPGYPDRAGYFQHVYSGKFYFACDPKPEEVRIEDIAHGLAMQCRFNGHVTKFYSVAEHCYHCSYIGPEEEAFERLMHDAAEAYIGDIIRPLKMIPVLSAIYLPIEKLNEEAIAKRFNLTYPWPASVRRADEMVVTAEMSQIIANARKGHLHDASEEADVKLFCWGPELAEKMFLARFKELAASRGVA